MSLDQVSIVQVNSVKVSNKTVLPFRWPGGKYYAIGKLTQFWENCEHDEYREPFLGGGSVFWAKPKSKINWLNDKDESLIRTLRVIQNPESRLEFVKLFEGMQEPTKESYALVKSMEPKSELEFAFRYYFLNRTSFSGKMKNPSWGYRPVRSLPPSRWHERIEPSGQKLEDVKLSTLDFKDVMLAPVKGKKVLMFLDPPYYHAKQESHYAVSFQNEDHVRLAQVAKETSHNFFLTYDDCPEIRELYSWAHIYDLEFTYRLDNSRDRQNTRSKGTELVITNYKPYNLNKELLIK